MDGLESHGMSIKAHKGALRYQGRAPKTKPGVEVDHAAGSNKILFHLRTLWLFTRSDLKSMVYPNIIFSLTGAIAGPLMTSKQDRRLLDTLHNLPFVAIWLWLNLLLFNIANQRLPSSRVEDRINKPWRPLPSGRLSPTQAKTLLLLVIPTTVLACKFYLGAPVETLLLISLTWIYNDLGGGDGHFILRNIINAFGMSFYSSGALLVACGNKCEVTQTGYQWIALIGLIILTTLQVQDMSDQEGDKIRGRKTLPLVIGDSLARWTIAVGVIWWSIGAPFFWKVRIEAYMLPLIIGGRLSLRILSMRSVEADKSTWRLWCLWMISLYLLPLWLPAP